MGRAVRPWLFDPGWLYVIAGLAMCSAITLIPARRDLAEIEGLLDRLEAREMWLGDRLGAHAGFIEALDREDDDLVVRLAAAQLNLVRAGEHPMLRTSVQSASINDWIETTVPPIPPPPAPESMSVLAQLVEGPARLWLLGASVMTIFIGLLIGPARSRHEAFGSLLARPDDAGDENDDDDAVAPGHAGTAAPVARAETAEPAGADEPGPPVIVVRARRVERSEGERPSLAVTVGDRITGTMSPPSAQPRTLPERGAGEIILRSELHAPPALVTGPVTGPATVNRVALDTEDDMHDEDMHDESQAPRPASSVESKDVVAPDVDASDIGGEDIGPDDEAWDDDGYEYVDEDGEPVDEDDEEYEYVDEDDEDDDDVDEEDELADGDEEPIDEDDEDDEESELVDDDGNPVDEDDEESELVDEDGNPVDEDDEESELVDDDGNPVDEDDEEYEYVDDDGNPVDEDDEEYELVDEDGSPVDEDDEESELVDEDGNPVDEDDEEYEYVDEEGNPVDEDDEESEPVDEDGDPVDEDDEEYEYVDEDGNPIDEDDEEYEYELVSEDGEPVDEADPAETDR